MTTANYDLGDDAPMFETPERVSILAVIGLVFGLLCFIPGTGVLAAILGVAALIGITGSRGRLSGRGLAIAAIVLGLIFSMIWGGVAIGGMKAWGGFKTAVLTPAGTLMQDIEAKNWAGARTRFSPEVGAAITDAEFEAFRAAYQAKVGQFQKMPDTLPELFSSYQSLGPSMQRFQPQPGAADPMVPLPGVFANGPALIVQYMDAKGSKGNGTPLWSNVLIFSTDGTEIRLVPSVTPPAAPSAPATPAVPGTGGEGGGAATSGAEKTENESL